MARNTGDEERSTRGLVLFVYNADSGFLNMLKDWTHKIVRPSTYECQLCALTYGNTGMRKKWQSFISELSFDTVFLHRDEFHKQYSHIQENKFPCIFIEEKANKTVKVLIDSETINKQETLEQLIDICNKSLVSF